MKKYLLLLAVILLTAAVVTATVLGSSKKPTKAKKECGMMKSKASCSKVSTVACY